jgi:hypothetical protein
LDLGQVAAHVADAGDPVRDEQRQGQRPRLGEMDVGVPQPGNEELAATVDRARALGRGAGDDLAAVHDHGASRLDRAALRIDDRDVPDDERLAGGAESRDGG